MNCKGPKRPSADGRRNTGSARPAAAPSTPPASPSTPGRTWEGRHMPDGAEQYGGLLVIGDPHLEGRAPGFRKDDYPRVILDKFEWCLRYAHVNRLLPTLLGDLFERPRDNPTWMLGSLIDLLTGVECVGIYGNHDCAEPQLSDHDSLS